MSRLLTAQRLPSLLAAALLAACSTQPSLHQSTDALATCAVISPAEGVSLTAADDVDAARTDIQVNVQVAFSNAAAGDSLELLVNGARAGEARAVVASTASERFVAVSLPRGPGAASLSCRIAGRETPSPVTVSVGESCGLRFANPAAGATVQRGQTRPGPDGRPLYAVVVESTGLPNGTPVHVELGDYGVAQFSADVVLSGGRAAVDVPLLPGLARLAANASGAACAPSTEVRFQVELGACSVALRTPLRLNASADTSPAPGLQTRVCVATDCADGAQAVLRVEGTSELMGAVSGGQACFDINVPEGSRSITARVDGVAQAGVALPLRTCVDVTPPLVAMAYPQDGLVIGGRDDADPSSAAYELRVSGVAASLFSPSCEPRLGASRVEIRVNGSVQQRFGQVADGPFERVVVLQPGANRVELCAYDSLENVACSPAANVEVDLVVPTMRFTTPENDALIGFREGKPDAPAPILIEVAAWKLAAGTSVRLADEKSDWSCTRQVAGDGARGVVSFTAGGSCPQLADGSHALRATAVDALRNEVMTPPLYVTVDSVPPRIDFSTPIAGEAVASERVEVLLSTDLEPGAMVTLRVGSGPALTGQVEPGGGVRFTGVSLVEGMNDLSATGADRAGNPTTTTVRVERDSNVPRPSFSDLVQDRVYGIEDDRDGFAGNGFQRDIRILAPGEPDGVAADLFVNDGAPVTAMVSNGQAFFPLVTLAEGSNALVARVRDRAGQAGIATVSFLVRTGAPRVVLTAPEAGRSFTAADDLDPATPGVQVAWRMDIGDAPLPTACELVVDPDSPAERHLTFQPSGFRCEGQVTLSEGSHVLQGRIAAQRPGVSVPVSVRVDTRAPVLTLVAPAGELLNASAVDTDGRPGFQTEIVVVADDIEAGQLATLQVVPDHTGLTAEYHAAFDEGGRAIFRGVSLDDISANTLKVSAGDMAGNAADSISRRLVVNREPPRIGIVSPAPGQLLGVADDESTEPGFQRSVTVQVAGVELGHTVQLTISAGKEGETREYTSKPLDGISSVVEFGAVDFPPSIGQPFTLRVIVADSAGNVASDELSLELDLTVGTLAWSEQPQGGLTFCGAASDDDPGTAGHQRLFKLLASGLPSGTEVVLRDGAGAEVGRGRLSDDTAAVMATIPEGTSTLIAEAREVSGNVALSEPWSMRLDTIGPAISELRCDGDRNSDGLLSHFEDGNPATTGVFEMQCQVFFSDESADGQQVQILSSYPSGAVVGSAMVMGATALVPVSLLGALTRVDHVLRAVSSDSCGNPSTGAAAYAATVDLTPLRLEVSVLGQGSVASTAPDGSLSCGPSCAAAFAYGTQVTLVATPAAYWRVAGWQGCDSVAGATCTVGLDAVRGVTASFARIQYSLGVLVSGTGSVAVGSPVGESCAGSCTYAVDAGSQVTLIASASPGWQFNAWGGACAGQGQSCSVLLTGVASSSASFTQSGSVLSVSLAGSGRIASITPGIDCGSTCSATFAPGTAVRLVATPASSAWIVGAWSGCASSSGATCDVTLDQSRAVSVSFDAAPSGWVDACEQQGMARHFDVPSDDDTTGALPLPFAFTFYGTTFNDVYVSTNAVVGFDSGTPEYSNTSLPASVGPTHAIYAFWDDLYTTSGNGLCTATVGEAGSRRFVITWKALRFFGSEDATSLTFSTILHEGTNKAEVIFYDMSSPQSGRGFGTDATIGVQAGSYVDQRGFQQSVVQNGTAFTFEQAP